MDSAKYVGMDVDKEAISVAVRNAAGKLMSLPRGPSGVQSMAQEAILEILGRVERGETR